VSRAHWYRIRILLCIRDPHHLFQRWRTHTGLDVAVAGTGMEMVMTGPIRGGFCHILRIPDTPSLATDRRLNRSLEPSAWDMAAGVLKDNGRKRAGHRPSNRDVYRS
jgi:hypothetical protein